MKKLLLILFVFTGCKLEISKIPTPDGIVEKVVLTPPPPVAPPAVSTPADKSEGWWSEYDTVIKTNVTPAMLNVPHWRMVKFCPKWPILTTEDKKQFWADWFFGVSKAESNWDSLIMSSWPEIGKDAVTGLPVVGVGLLQIAYQDNIWAKCGLDYTKDKTSFLQDLKNKGADRSWRSKNPKLSIITNNLKCGVNIVDYRLRIKREVSQINANQDFIELMAGRVVKGKYVGGQFGTMRPGPDKFDLVVGMMKDRKSKCF